MTLEDHSIRQVVISASHPGKLCLPSFENMLMEIADTVIYVEELNINFNNDVDEESEEYKEFVKKINFLEINNKE